MIGSSGKISNKIRDIAEEVGQEIARRGAILITGGRDGVMEAASQGAKNMNGLTIGILPEHNKSKVNPHVDVAIPTGIAFARNYINVVASDAIISLAGSGGTLSEIGFAIALSKPLILIKGTGGVTDLIAQHHELFPEANIYIAENGLFAVNLVFNHYSN
ncbi:MAG: TIGR00725 family protein [Candidatus Odinarchaeota archaeon]